MKTEYLEEVRDFLIAYFHQDIDSPEKALTEFLNENTKECLSLTIQRCTAFLNNDMTNEDKEAFIYNNTEIYFTKLTPLQWLNKLVVQMQTALKERV